ncbi:MAG TPA: dienelactone hydrolase family protein [Verrucomicrobiae bacterium]
MTHSVFRFGGLVALTTSTLLGISSFTASAQLAEKDQRYQAPKTLNTLRTFIDVKSRADWQKESAEIRTHILVSCGLYPLPPKTPLNAKVTDSREMDGYILEKVSIETYPGFFLAGNLFRPLNQGKGPFPAVLNPHGHWTQGRLADEELGSIQARCITQARMGMVAFAYDMVGYCDTMQFSTAKGDMGKHRVYGMKPEDQLWGISMMGLQLWNSIRVVDFLSALPDVDPKRIGCTGESGGGTQTFMLTAVDDRVKVSAPCVMVSHSMQGGCTCENAPGLRVDYSNMEIAASAAPRPQLLVAATGDWTKKTMEVEGPAVESVYKLLSADKSIRYVIFDYPHNYNLTSRQAVYPWLGQHLLKKPDTNSYIEKPYQKLGTNDLLLWAEGKGPTNALSYVNFLEELREIAKTTLANYAGGKSGVYQKAYEPVWKHSLQLDLCDTKDIVSEEGHAPGLGKKMLIGRSGEGDRVPVLVFTPHTKASGKVAVLASPNGPRNLADTQGRPSGLAAALLQRGFTVVIPELFQTGGLYQRDLAEKRNYFTNFFTTYNRTDAQERAQDLVTTIAYARSLGKKVTLCGLDRAGLWAMMAAPAADAVVLDAQSFNSQNEHLLLADDLFSPNLQRLGGLDGIIALAAPNPVLIHNTGGQFNTKTTELVYGPGAKSLRIERNRFDDLALLTWISEQ